MVKNKSTGAGHLVRIFGLIVALAAVMGLVTCENGILKGLNDGDDDAPPPAPVYTNPVTPPPPIVYSQRDVTPGLPQKQITLISTVSAQSLFYSTDNGATISPYTPFPATAGQVISVYSSASPTSLLTTIPVLDLAAFDSGGSPTTGAPKLMGTVKVVGTSGQVYSPSDTTYAWRNSAGVTLSSSTPGICPVDLSDYDKMIEVTVTGPGMSAQISTMPVEANDPWIVADEAISTQTLNMLLTNNGPNQIYIKDENTTLSSVITIPAGAVGATKEIKGLGSTPRKITINDGSGTATSAITINANTTLILGKNLLLTGTPTNLVEVESNGTLILRGATIGGESSTSLHTGRGVLVGGGSGNSNGGRFIMESGTISWNNNNLTSSAGYGAGVRLEAYSTFEMTGGAISNNTATGGAGVYGIANSTFRMSGNGTTISDNIALLGGGVQMGSNAHAEMTGGTILGNTATSGAYGGGGVYLAVNSIFRMTGGTISNNTAAGHGAGVYINDTTNGNAVFEMTAGATISGNTATGRGGGVCVGKGTFKAIGSTASQFNSLYQSGNSASGGGAAVAVTDSTDGYFYLPTSTGPRRMTDNNYPLTNGWLP
ncbi:autotransporter outer membrane beta-barrel domain-containing protein [Breznakiellaceae bacterium SP9]